MARRIVLHVGLPKTGTSFLQQVLWDNAAVLAEHGVRPASRTRRQMFAAALHLSGRDYDWDPVGMDPAQAWRQILRRARGFDGTTVLSNEWLATADAALADRAVGELADFEVDLVVTVRDLGRQLPAEWQEGVKHGRSNSWPSFLDTVLGDAERPGLRQRFWAAQDPVDVARRWGHTLAPGRVHLVTSPPPGTDPGVLWGRFAQVLGVPADVVTLPGRDVNTSLGRPQVEVLRRVNSVFPRRGQELRHRALVKRYLAREVLAPQQGERTTLPERWRPEVARIVADWEKQICEAGYDVVGDLADLRPAAPVTGAADEPGRLAQQDETLRAFAETTGNLLREIESLRAELARERRPGPVRARLAGLRRRVVRTPRPDLDES